MYIVPYEAEYECPKGHVFVAEASPFKDDGQVMCPTCYANWIKANVPNGMQKTKAVPKAEKVAQL